MLIMLVADWFNGSAWELGEASLLNRIVIASCFLSCALPALLGQATSTASRKVDLQVGVGFVYNNADYPYKPETLKGVGFYSTLDFSHHFGAEFAIHQANTGTGDGVYQRTYEIGPRYVRTYGRFAPYVKAMYGRGVFNFPLFPGITPPPGTAPPQHANLAYNMFAGGAGVDVRILPFLNVRADYEYQDWMGFPVTALTPQLVTIGVAYHFPGDLKKGKHF